MKIIGHRGASGYEPENTLAAFKRALSLGVDMIELDVHVLASGEVVVTHDTTFNRTTSSNGLVADYTLEQLSGVTTSSGEKIPLLTDVLDLVNKKAPINIELKGANTAGPVAKIIEHYTSNKNWPTDMFLVSAFRRAELKNFVELQPGIKVSALFKKLPADYQEYVDEIKAYSVNLDARYIDSKDVESIKARNLKVFAYTVNTPEQVRQMLALNIDGIFTDYPDQVIQALNVDGIFTDYPDRVMQAL